MSLTNKLTTSGGGNGSDPFQKSGLARSPPTGGSAEAVEEVVASGSGTPVVAEKAKPDISKVGPALIRAVEKRRGMRPTMVALAEQVDAIIDFMNGRNNISKDLKQSLMMVRATIVVAKKERDELEARLEVAERMSVTASKEAQTEAFYFAVDSTMARESMEYATRSANGKAQKRTRRPSDEEQPGGSKKRMVRSPRSPRSTGTDATKKRRGGSPKTGKDKGRDKGSVPSGGPGPSRTPHPVTPAGDSQKAGPGDRVDDNADRWEKVRRSKRKRTVKENTRRKRSRRHQKGDALIVKTEEAKYSEVLKAMRGEAQLSGLGADVRSIRRTRAGDMILELKRDSKQRGPAYKLLAEKVLGEGVQVRALTTEVTLQCKNLDEITESREISTALKDQCGVEVAVTAIRLRKGPYGTQVAAIRLPEVEADLAMKTGRLKVGWSVCSLSILQPLDACFRCFERGHKSWECKGPDRSKLCRRCGGAGHKARDCELPPKCMTCSGKPDDRHATGGPRCPATKGRPDRK